jgi:ATP-dependent DNA helicase PIF1
MQCQKGHKLGTSLIQGASLIVWDEAPMMHQHAFMAVNATLQDIMGEVDPSFGDLLFGGKVAVLGGDFRQILPVVVKGPRQTSCVP